VVQSERLHHIRTNSIYEPRRALMSESPAKRGKVHGGAPAERPAADAVGPARVRKTAAPKKNHCPPYLDPWLTYDIQTDDTRLVKAAATYFKVIGRCQCDAQCKANMMTQFTFTPWTRFPVPNAAGVFDGHYLNEKFQAWWNPTAHYSNCEVRPHIKGFLLEEDRGGQKVLLPNYSTSSRTCKFEKFWLAVHVLYEWVTCKHGVDDRTLKMCIANYYHTKQYIDCAKGARGHYVAAGILGDDTEQLKTVFREFRPDLNLTPTQKDELMAFLLTKKSEVQALFRKMDYLRTRESLNPQGRATLLQWTPAECAAFTSQQCTAESLQQRLQQNPIDIRFAGDPQADDPFSNDLDTKEADAAAALLGLCAAGGGPARAQALGTDNKLRMLLDCLYIE
jgi:hypothetical protein